MAKDAARLYATILIATVESLLSNTEGAGETFARPDAQAVTDVPLNKKQTLDEDTPRREHMVTRTSDVKSEKKSLAQLCDTASTAGAPNGKDDFNGFLPIQRRTQASH